MQITVDLTPSLDRSYYHTTEYDNTDDISSNKKIISNNLKQKLPVVGKKCYKKWS